MPLQGIGWGNRSSTVIWVVVSTAAFDILRSLGYGVYFKAAISKEIVRFVGFDFIDNMDQIQSLRTPYDEIYDTAAQFQEVLDAWEGALSNTGGDIDPIKSVSFGN